MRSTFYPGVCINEVLIKLAVMYVGVGVFRKLMTSLVDSTMSYGSEIWGCNRDLEKIEQV